MSEERFLKEKDLLINCIEKNTKEHWENYYKDVPIKCIYEDLVIDINEIKRQQEEIEKLKRENEALKQTHEYDLNMIDNVKGQCVKLQNRINKAIKKINNIFDEGNEDSVIDDLLELDKILNGEKK